MIRNFAIGILVAALACIGSAQLSAQDVPAQDAVRSDWPQFLISDGETVIDSVNNVVWLADANLAAKILPDKMPPDNNFRFGLPLCPDPTIVPTEACVNKSGSMNYTSAVAWVQGMNDANYLGHSDWELPTAPLIDHRCSGTGPEPYSEGFAFHCKLGALGYLYYTAFGFHAPDTAVPFHPTRWGHSSISNLMSIGPIRPVATRTACLAPLPISVSPAGPRAAVAEVISRMFCR